ncbi:MAG: hypothetical protein AAFY88_31490, partial [Acidobacteriota bacterium]
MNSSSSAISRRRAPDAVDGVLERSLESALLVAHPGHELRLHRWLELEKPLTFVLTDGSGHGGESRLASTRRILDDAGCEPASVFGRWTDREAYRIIIEGDVDAVKAVVVEVADALARRGVRRLASDAIEGFNAVHDLCYVIAECAAAQVGRRQSAAVQHVVFPLEAAPSSAVAGT